MYGYADAVRERVWVPIEFDTRRRRHQRPDLGRHHPPARDRERAQGPDHHGRQPVLRHGLPRQRGRVQVRRGRRRPQRQVAAVLRQLLRAARVRGRAARHRRDEQLDRLPDGRRPRGHPRDHPGDRLAQRPRHRLRRAVGRREGDRRTGAPGTSACGASRSTGRTPTGRRPTGVEGLRTIVPISGISSWYKYYRIGGLRFSSGGPSGLANTVTFPARREQCAPSRQRIATGAGEGSQPPETAGNFNEFWDERDYEKHADRVEAVRVPRPRAQRLQRQAQQLRRVVGQPRGQRRPAQDLADAARARRPVRLRPGRVGRDDPPLVRLLAAGHRQRRDGRAARPDRAAARPRRADAGVQDVRRLPRPGRAAHGPLAALPVGRERSWRAVDSPAADAGDRVVGRPARAVHRAHAGQRAADREAGDRRSDRDDEPEPAGRALARAGEGRADLRPLVGHAAALGRPGGRGARRRARRLRRTRRST